MVYFLFLFLQKVNISNTERPVTVHTVNVWEQLHIFLTMHIVAYNSPFQSWNIGFSK